MWRQALTSCGQVTIGAKWDGFFPMEQIIKHVGFCRAKALKKMVLA
jgi:hypothetical protein